MGLVVVKINQYMIALKTKKEFASGWESKQELLT